MGQKEYPFAVLCFFQLQKKYNQKIFSNFFTFLFAENR